MSSSYSEGSSDNVDDTVLDRSSESNSTKGHTCITSDVEEMLLDEPGNSQTVEGMNEPKWLESVVSQFIKDKKNLDYISKFMKNVLEDLKVKDLMQAQIATQYWNANMGMHNVYYSI